VKVLVTGGTGFVGSQLVAALVKRGDRVRVLRRANSSLVALEGLQVEHVIGDILEPEAVARAVKGCDLVFHVAAISSYWRAQREQVYRINVEGTRVVMEACCRAGVPRVVHTSSLAAVGIPLDGTLATEETPFDALSATFAYADSKHRAEAEVQKAVARGLQAVIVNPAVVIGAGDHYLISGSMIVEFARGHMIAVPPGGTCMADVDAIVQGHLAAAARGRVGERYILGGENLTYRQVVQILAEVTGRPAPRLSLPPWLLGPAAVAVDTFNHINPRPPIVSGEQMHLSAVNFFCDSSKAVRELGYPILPFRAAAERAYCWYLRHGYMT
jgi:dihydroflavonol-4-reductase